MNQRPLDQEFDKDAELRGAMANLDAEVITPSGHDMEVLRAARATAQSIQARRVKRPRWHVPMSMAASFIVGIGMATAFFTTSVVTPPNAAFQIFTIPSRAVTRGAGAASDIPVEEAPADDWYRYIQELIYSGDVELATKHLNRFAELHPDFEYRP